MMPLPLAQPTHFRAKCKHAEKKKATSQWSLNINREEIESSHWRASLQKKERGKKSPIKQQYASLTILITSALVTNNRTTTQDSSHHEPQTTNDWEPKVDSRSCEHFDSNFPHYMQHLRIRHLAETLSHFPLLTTRAHLATRTAAILGDAPRVFTWAVLLYALHTAVKKKQCLSFHSQNNAHREMDQQHTITTREQYNAQRLVKSHS